MTRKQSTTRTNLKRCTETKTNPEPRAARDTSPIDLPPITSRKQLARAVNTVTQAIAAGVLSANATPILRALELAEKNFAPRTQKVVHLQVATQLQEGGE